MHFIWKLIKTLFLLALVIVLAAGLYAGNMAYEELFTAPWDRILGIENHRKDLTAIHSMEDRYGWHRVTVPSKDGTNLRGTYIEDRNGSKKAVILLHGLYQNRSMCLPYVTMYRNLGYNVLLVDLRGHGESDGIMTDWGIHDVDDMNAWVDFLRSKNRNMEIGLHGFSLGAAMALIYSGSKEGQDMKFYVADSSYGNLLELGREKIMTYTGDERLVLGMNILNPFMQAAMFYHTGKLLSAVDPIAQVTHMTSPVLFLHGGADQLIPPSTAEELLAASSSQNKQLYIFQGAGHTMEMAANSEAYRGTVQKFLLGLPH
jgi:fermentation-respiration switch protein FrsA (DUF1100 family)